jgi:DNA (cytosine-5)-methyltransferase 1
MTKPRLLVLFCGAGGCDKGYEEAGFECIGVDIRPMPNYCGSDFILGDALEVMRLLLDGEEVQGWRLEDFAGIHASPPCQAWSSLGSLNPEVEYPKLIEPTRALVEAADLPYVIENVPGAPLLNPIMLCGSSLGLQVRRHRLFECSFPTMSPGCSHGQENGDFPVGLGSPTNAIRKRRGEVVRSKVAFVYGSTRYAGDLADRKRAMGVDWMTNRELTQAIPPAYTKHIGFYLKQAVETAAVA